eukprot:snap_masked-scaffold_1-processed-gene-17.19-mRNA-1 protein AED:1.00 eAED:1.00 QI:0/0/0/0/1/1/2/0/100
MTKRTRDLVLTLAGYQRNTFKFKIRVFTVSISGPMEVAWYFPALRNRDQGVVILCTNIVLLGKEHHLKTRETVLRRKVHGKCELSVVNIAAYKEILKNSN